MKTVFCNHSFARCPSLDQTIPQAVPIAAIVSKDIHPVGIAAITATAAAIAQTICKPFFLIRVAAASVNVPSDHTFFVFVI